MHHSQQLRCKNGLGVDFQPVSTPATRSLPWLRLSCLLVDWLTLSPVLSSQQPSTLWLKYAVFRHHQVISMREPHQGVFLMLKSIDFDLLQNISGANSTLTFCFGLRLTMGLSSESHSLSTHISALDVHDMQHMTSPPATWVALQHWDHSRLVTFVVYVLCSSPPWNNEKPALLILGLLISSQLAVVLQPLMTDKLKLLG